MAGIIAEYNPFHRGHRWQIQTLRRLLGADAAVVAVMSGNFVQRGDFAVLEKRARAECALLGGADLVLELPSPWSAATAERFAQGGVALLAATGVVTHLAFGCETGDLGPLAAAARCLENPGWEEAARRHLAAGVTFAAARQAAVRDLAGEGAAACLSRPNDILAVEYLRAAARQGAALRPLALPRVGAPHDSGDLGPYPSASAIRGRLLAGESWRELLPEETAQVLDREMAAGRAPASLKNCERAVLARLRRMAEEDFRPYDGGGEGLYHRFYGAVQSCTRLEDILAGVKTKRYPLARIRRLLLHSCLGLVPASQGQTPPYLRVLGANDRGRALLGEMRKKAALPVVTKPAAARRLGAEARDLLAREAVWTDLYTLSWPDLDQAKPGLEYTAGPVMR